MEENDELNDFLQGKLSGESLEKFREKVDNDPELSKKVEEEIALKHGVIYANRLAMKNRFDALDEAESQAKDEVRLASDKEEKEGGFPYLKIAAGLVIIFAFGYLIMNGLSGPDYQRIADEYYEGLASIELQVGRGGVEDRALINEAFKDYQDGRYASSRQKLDQLSSERVLRAYGYFVEGLTWMEEGAYEKALVAFDLASDVSGLDFTPSLYWYSALCHVQLEQIDEAKELLNKLTDSELYGDEVKRLLEEL